MSPALRVVFTLPKQLYSSEALQNPVLIYGLLFKAIIRRLCWLLRRIQSGFGRASDSSPCCITWNQRLNSNPHS